MRRFRFVLPLVLAACGHHHDSGAPSDLANDGYQIVTPDFTLQPGDEKFLCYYTTLPSSSPVGVRRWESHMTPGSHHMILYATPTALAPDGAVQECVNGPASEAANTNANVGDRSEPPVWAYATQQPDAVVPLPAGVGVTLRARQPLIVNMHYINTTTAPRTVHVELNIKTFAEGEQFTPAAAFVTFNTQIAIPAKGTQTVGGTCTVPEGAQFLGLVTHSHMYTQEARVSDGDLTLVKTVDWQNPNAARWETPYTFHSGQLTYQCTYRNSTDGVISVGQSATKNEMCMAVGYFFPAPKQTLCLNSTIVPL
jgi:hypothetical protein